MTPQEQAFQLGRAWEAMPAPKRQFVTHIVHPDMTAETFRIGPHNPSLKGEDVDLVHRLWLSITREPGMDKLHHSDIVTEALTRFAREYTGHEREELLKELRKHTGGKHLGEGTQQRAALPRPPATPPPPLADPSRPRHPDSPLPPDPSSAKE
jgi:hypothetical protein